MGVELHFIDLQGHDLGTLPSYTEINISPVFCDYGSLDFTYPRDGIRFDLPYEADEFEIAVYIDGLRQPTLGGIFKDLDGDDIAEGGSFKFSGITYLCLLDEGVTYPKGWPNYDPRDPTQSFASATAGFLMKTFIGQCQTRGTLQGITTSSFSSQNDSLGRPWTKTISLEFKPGVKMSSVLKDLVAQGMCEFEMVGRDLRMYLPGTLSVDRTTQAKPLVFRKGRDLSDSPRKRTSRDVTTVLLGAGKEDSGVYHEEVDTAAVAGRRRIEGFISNGNITDPGTLEAYVEDKLSIATQAAMEKSHGLVFATKKSPRPLRDFNVGDWAWSDVGRGVERLRIKQWVLTVSQDGSMSGSVTLNDLFAETSERLNKRIDGILGGTSITGESRAVDTIPSDLVDGMPPAIPTGLSVTSEGFTTSSGVLWAQATATWLGVTTNDDGSAIDDFDHYVLRWRYADEPADSWSFLSSSDPAVSWSPLRPNEQIHAQVQAVDRSSNASGWSTDYTVITGGDDVPPPKPSTPVVDNYLGLIRVRWNGLTSTGSAMPIDLKNVEVHVSATNNFTPDSTTIIDTVLTSGSSFYKGTYGATYYARLVAVDYSSNRSTISDVGSGVSAPVVSADVFDGAIGSSKLADLAVITAKINDLAVNNAKIGDLAVGKLTSGTMTAEVAVSGRFTTALTGARVEMNALGIRLIDATGAVKVALNSDGTASFTGTITASLFRTATAGARLEIDSTTALRRDIRFYGTTGTQFGAVRGIDYGASGAGVIIEGGLNTSNQHGYMTVTMDYADLWFQGASGIASFIRLDDTQINLNAAVNRPINLATNSSVSLYSGTSLWGRLNPDNSMERITKFALGGGPNNNFTFGVNVGGLDADIYALRFISTNAGATGGFVYFSDETLKANIADSAWSGAELVKATRVRDYTWKETGKKSRGFIAQEVPEMARVVNRLNEDSDPVEGVSLDAMVVILWKAVGEILDTITSIKGAKA